MEVFGGEFDAYAEVIWDAGGAEQVLTPDTVEPERIVVTLPSALCDTARTVPVAIEQTADGRCATVDYCEALDWGGHDDWVLPIVKELSRIVDSGRVDPAIDPVSFPWTQVWWFWSSSVYAGATGYAWLVGFGIGVVYYYDEGYGSRVRCVRRGP